MVAPKKQLMFVHIPKTAGTTFVLILGRLFKWNKTLSYYSAQGRKNHVDFSAAYKNKFDLSYGHIPFIPDQGLERGIEYFTFLRKPRERLLSGYKYLKGDKDHGIEKATAVADTYLLKDFLKQGVIKNFDNLMVRYLSNNIEKAYLEINEADLELAIKNFDTYFQIFGLTEYFNESLVLLSDYMKWAPLYYVKENKSSFKAEELDEETEKLIEACNKYDEVLYKHAHAKFLKMMADKRGVLDKGLEELKKGNEKYKLIISFHNKSSLLYSYIRRKLT